MKRFFINISKILFLGIFILSNVPFIPPVFASGSLAVTGITAIKTSAIADNTFGNGWSWSFHVTLPANENHVRMKFANFSNGDSTIHASNIRLYSAQSTTTPDGAHAIPILHPMVFSDVLIIDPSADLDAGSDGIQIDIIVEVRVPNGTTGSGYTTSYGISSERPPAQLEEPPVTEGPDNTIISGLCLLSNTPTSGPYPSITSGYVRFNNQNHYFPGLNMQRSINPSFLASGNDWLVYVKVYPDLVNGHSLVPFPETRDPLSITDLTLVGKIHYDANGNYETLESSNPDCNPQSPPGVWNIIQSGMCFSLVEGGNPEYPEEIVPVISPGYVRFYGNDYLYKGNALKPASSTKGISGEDWNVLVRVYPTPINEYLENYISFVSYDGSGGSDTIVGRIKYDEEGNVILMKSVNDNCPEIAISKGPEESPDIPQGEVVNAKPVITLLSPSNITIPLNSWLMRTLAKALDIEDGDLTGDIVYDGSLEVTKVGDYVFKFNVTDSNGNAADTVIQTIHVVPSTTEVQEAYQHLYNLINEKMNTMHSVVVGSDHGQYPRNAIEVFSLALHAALDTPLNISIDGLTNPTDIINALHDAETDLLDAYAIFLEAQN